MAWRWKPKLRMTSSFQVRKKSMTPSQGKLLTAEDMPPFILSSNSWRHRAVRQVCSERELPQRSETLEEASVVTLGALKKKTCEGWT